MLVEESCGRCAVSLKCEAWDATNQEFCERVVSLLLFRLLSDVFLKILSSLEGAAEAQPEMESRSFV